ncbi:VOC family protein [Streptomyces sp. NPDC058045]|uniref:VOC family protein n=1 Tax=Streptomyces sp. NPDC058045 TaxID=3346311 RepID=UPI0036EF1AEA
MTDHSARFDHLVLWVEDPVASAAFYERTLNLLPLRLAEYIDRTVPFPSVRLTEETIIDLMPRSMAPRMTMLPGAAASAGHPVNHFCVALTGAGFDALLARLAESGTAISAVSEDSFGARGNAVRSFYFADPDGNIVEARHYDPAPTP